MSVQLAHPCPECGCRMDIFPEYDSDIYTYHCPKCDREEEIEEEKE